MGLEGRERAIVVGASMAGMLAARALADHFREVVLVERDHLPAEAVFRAGVPQSRHVHVLLVRGAQLLEELLPGIGGELRAAGAVDVEWPRDVLWLSAGGWSLRWPGGLRLISCRRELTDWAVRRRVLALPPVRVEQSVDAVGLLPGRRGGVAGVRLRARAGGAPRDLAADLVVDASGRDSRVPAWLEALGYPAPPETVINSFLGYSSCTFAPPEGFTADWRMLLLQPRPPASSRAGGLLPIEGGHWIVTLAGAGGDYPPTSLDGFLAFTRTLRSPLLYETLARAQPLTPVVGYRRTENQLRHFDALRRWPDGLLAVGDAVCTFNPVYGQGMTTAALGAHVLGRCLAEGRLGLAFQRRLARAVKPAWALATAEDFRYPTTVGGRPDLPTRLLHRYTGRLLDVSPTDPLVAKAFLEVLHLIAPPAALFAPRIVVRALRGPARPALLEPPTASRPPVAAPWGG